MFPCINSYNTIVFLVEVPKRTTAFSPGSHSVFSVESHSYDLYAGFLSVLAKSTKLYSVFTSAPNLSLAVKTIRYTPDSHFRVSNKILLSGTFTIPVETIDLTSRLSKSVLLSIYLSASSNLKKE